MTDKYASVTDWEAEARIAHARADRAERELDALRIFCLDHIREVSDSMSDLLDSIHEDIALQCGEIPDEVNADGRAVGRCRPRRAGEGSMGEILDKLHEQGQTVYLSGEHGEAVKTIYLDGVYRTITPDMEALCAYCDGLLQAERAEVRRLRAMLEPTPDARELAEEIQNIKWLIDEGPAHEKLTEAQVRLRAVKEKIVARNNILTNDSYNLTTVLYNHMTRGPWKHIPPEFIEERKAEVAPLIAAHDARLLDEAAERAVDYLYKSKLIEYRDERGAREIRAAVRGEVE